MTEPIRVAYEIEKRRADRFEAERDRAEAVVAAQREALRPFAEYHRWKMAKGMKGKPPAIGPKELQTAAEALDAERKPENSVRGTVHSASAPEGVSEPPPKGSRPASGGSLTSPVDTRETKC